MDLARAKPQARRSRIAAIARRLNWRLLLALTLNAFAWAAIVALWRA